MKQLKTNTGEWLKAAVAMLPVAATVADVDWKAVAGTAALAAIASILTSLGGLPEVEE